MSDPVNYIQAVKEEVVTQVGVLPVEHEVTPNGEIKLTYEMEGTVYFLVTHAENSCVYLCSGTQKDDGTWPVMAKFYWEHITPDQVGSFISLMVY